jgi:hypothetical protein
MSARTRLLHTIKVNRQFRKLRESKTLSKQNKPTLDAKSR